MCNFNFARGARAAIPWGVSVIILILMAAPGLGAKVKPAAEKSGAKTAARPTGPEAAIRASAAAFVKAFDTGDAKAVASLWTVDGTMADDRGTIFKGRKAIEGQYAAFFKAHPGAKIVVDVKSIDFPTPSVAVEDGTSRVIGAPYGPPVVGRYTVVHVLENGKWRMASVRETTVPLASNIQHLEDLGWLIGTWENKHDTSTIRTTFRWIANKSFIQRDYRICQEGVQTMAGVQIIGWDPRAGQIRSWSFDGAGGYGTSLWTPTPDGWHADSTGVMPDGTPTASQEMLIRVAGEGSVLGWRSFARRVGDMALPDTPEVVLDRVSKTR